MSMSCSEIFEKDAIPEPDLYTTVKTAIFATFKVSLDTTVW